MTASRLPTAPSGTLRDVTDKLLPADIARVIRAAGGWIGFDRFMELALYSPGKGYYSGGQAIFGAGGDFTTAPESTPLFGRVVARQLAAWLDAWPGSAPAPVIIEFGGGSGALAAALLPALADLGHGQVAYRIVELSASLRARQRDAIAVLGGGLLERVRWLDALPTRIDGIVIGNEVLDAMPVRVFECQHEGAVAEMGVVAGEGVAVGQGVDAGESAGVGEGGGVEDAGFVWAARPADPSLVGRVRALEEQAGPWPRPYRSEIAEQAEAWVRTVASRIGVGALLLFDYGFADSEFYHPQRDQGTLMAHHRHRAHTDVLHGPGRQDITAHVPFTAIRDAAEAEGLAILGYCAQARFLINAGLLEAFAAVPREPVVEWARSAQAVQRLLSEAEMGELFKVVAFGRGLAGEPWLPGFRDGDRSGRL